MAKPAPALRPRTLRCAIYTRKSTEEGLDQTFNSLHAQREACEAYVLSQVGEGWSALKAVYDDGGFSGGSMERPALRRLLADIAIGKVDVVVVYKVDRLTRSLADFAKIVEVFDAASVSFVSVTQAFNTTTSMGRLTLNVLLSFAQFEREVTGERIRDKIAASKAKGTWMGGVAPLGYQPKDRTLVIDPEGAEQVRRLYRRYLELRSVPALKAELDAAGVVSPVRLTRAGQTRGGEPYAFGPLFHLLRNPIYIGPIAHREVTYPGLHPPIIGKDLFDSVQETLASNRQKRRERPTRVASSPLAGKIFDADGGTMSPSFGYGRSDRIYRYFISASLMPGRGGPTQTPGAVRRVSAPAIESLVIERLRRWVQAPGLEWPDTSEVLQRVELHAEAIHLVVTASKIDLSEAGPAGYTDSRLVMEGRGRNRVARLIIARRPVFRGGRTWQGGIDDQARQARTKPSPTLIHGLRRVHRGLRDLNSSPLTPDHELAASRAPEAFRIRRTLSLAFLAPDIQRAIFEGRQPQALTLLGLVDQDVPLLWSDQRRALGFEA